MGQPVEVKKNLIKHILTLVKRLVEGLKRMVFYSKGINIFMEQYY